MNKKCKKLYFIGSKKKKKKLYGRPSLCSSPIPRCWKTFQSVHSHACIIANISCDLTYRVPILSKALISANRDLSDP